MSEEQKNNEEKAAAIETSNENNAPADETSKKTAEENNKGTEKTANANVTAAVPNKNTDAPQEKKNKKINLMSLKELEQAIDKTKKNQGGLYSRYALELVKRKEFFNNSKKK